MLISRMELKKILSFRETTVELGQLNVLIGPNAVGKSNLIEVLSLLQATPNGFATAILRGGGVRQWIWLGDRDPSRVAEVVCELNLTGGRQRGYVKYGLRFSEHSNSNIPIILHEHIARVNPEPGSDGVYLNRESNQAEFGSEALKLQQSKQIQMFLSPPESVLAQFKNPADPTPITEVGNHFARIRIFREFRTGPQSGARQGIATNAQKEALMDGGDNLALVLNDLNFQDVHDRIRAYLKRFCERFEDIKIDVGEGLARTFLREDRLVEKLSAIRMCHRSSEIVVF